MTRFFDDLSYVLQSGAGKKIFQRGGLGFNIDIAAILKNFLAIIIILVLVYIIYNILIGSYPRVIVNVITGSMYHKESMENFLRENAILSNSIKIILMKGSGCADAHATFDFLYGTDICNKLYEKMRELNATISDSYPEFKYEEKIYNAFKNYYLYHNISIKNEISYIDTPKKRIAIKNKEIYEQMLGAFINAGLIDPRKKSDDALLIEMYNLDSKNKFVYVNRIAAIKPMIDKIASIMAEISGVIKKNPYLSYVIVPENSNDFQAFLKDYSKFTDKIKDGSVYKEKFSNINNFSWFIIEYLQYKNNPNVYSKFVTELEQYHYNPEERSSIKKYLNLVPELKKVAESRILNRVFDKKEPKLEDPSRDIEDEVLYEISQRCSPKFLDYVKKHPIFSHIYFSGQNDPKMQAKGIAEDPINFIKDKPDFYKKIMTFYDRLCTNCNTVEDPKKYMDNLSVNAIALKNVVNAMNVFDLYVNRYKGTITQTFQDQNYANKFFFTRMIKPYYEDFVINRMGTYYKKTFSAANWKSSYNKFLVKWQSLGQMLKDVMKSIASSFNESDNIEKPAAEDTDDGQGSPA